MKDDILIINGKKYVHTPEVKEEKRERITVAYCHIYDRGFKHLRWSRHIDVIKDHEHLECVKLIETRENEIIVSEDEAFLALSCYMHSPYLEKGKDYKMFLECLGFKKDGV